MPVTVVVGSQWGDEGKAKVIDLLSGDHDLVVRYQGGHNAGHTIVAGGEKYALQLVPSGVLYPHVTPVIANGVVVDPVTLLDEVGRLSARGVDTTRLRVSSQAHLILPWHFAHDRLAEAQRGDNKIGPTLKGIGPAYADKARRVGLRVGDMLDRKRFAEQLRQLGAAENNVIVHLGGEPLDIDAIVEQYAGDLAARVEPYITNTVSLLHDAVAAGKRVLLVGAPATFLDIDHGTYPYVTSSSPTAGGACSGTGLGPRDLGRIVGIAKAYTTRVGSGPFPTELTDSLGDALVDIGREFGTVTGRRRRTGWLDTVMLRHAVRLNSLTEIALTKLDVLDTFDTVKVCTGYEVNGALISDYPDRLDALAQVRPVYTELPGWKASIEQARSMKDLPRAAAQFVELVEREVGVPFRYVGVGADRDAVVERP
ncbi:MAG: adenylosuccinate synthase [Ilumatobacteraceae bacterium]